MWLLFFVGLLHSSRASAGYSWGTFNYETEEDLENDSIWKYLGRFSGDISESFDDFHSTFDHENSKDSLPDSVTLSPTFRQRPRGYSSSPIGIQYSGIFTRCQAGHREFILDVVIYDNVYPVVFDTGSTTMWVADHLLAQTSKHIASNMPGPFQGSIEIDGPTSLGYMADSSVACGAWYLEDVHTGLDPFYASWIQQVCVAKETTIVLSGFLGVIGASRDSQFVKEHPIFWLTTSHGSDYGLMLEFSRTIDQTICATPLVSVPLQSRPHTSIHWEFAAQIRVGQLAPFAVHASPDTGVHALFVGAILWDTLMTMWTQKGFTVVQSVAKGRFYSETACRKIRTLPSITISIGRFTYILKGSDYTQQGRGRCFFDVSPLSLLEGNLVLIGANILKKINTRFNHTDSTIAFCHPA